MANNPILLTAPQAAELHTTGRLTGYREKCEVEGVPPDAYISFNTYGDGNWTAEWSAGDPGDFWQPVECRTLTPPRDTDTTYAVKEPWWQVIHDIGGQTRRTAIFNIPPGRALPAEELPDDQIRQHARITDRKLIIEDGELWWDMDLEKVG